MRPPQRQPHACECFLAGEGGDAVPQGGVGEAPGFQHGSPIGFLTLTAPLLLLQLCLCVLRGAAHATAGRRKQPAWV